MSVPEEWQGEEVILVLVGGGRYFHGELLEMNDRGVALRIETLERGEETADELEGLEWLIEGKAFVPWTSVLAVVLRKTP